MKSGEKEICGRKKKQDIIQEGLYCGLYRAPVLWNTFLNAKVFEQRSRGAWRRSNEGLAKFLTFLSANE